MLVPPDAHTELPSDRPPHILVPLDGSPLAEAALGPAGEWAGLLGAEIILMQVVFWPPLIYGDGAELMELDADKEVALANEYLHAHCRTLANHHHAGTLPRPGGTTDRPPHCAGRGRGTRGPDCDGCARPRRPGPPGARQRGHRNLATSKRPGSRGSAPGTRFG